MIQYEPKNEANTQSAEDSYKFNHGEGCVHLSKQGKQIKFDSEIKESEFIMTDEDQMFEFISNSQIRCLKINFPESDFSKRLQKLDESLTNQYNNIKKLKLILRNTNMTMNEAFQVSNIIEQCKESEELCLSLRGNLIEDTGACSILEAIKSLKFLKVIKLGLTGIGIKDKTIKQIISLLKEKEKDIIKLQVHIGGNTFEKGVINEFIIQLSKMENLSFLSIYLDRCPVFRDTLDDLCDTVVTLKKLTKLQISILFSQLKNSDYCQLARTIQNKENLHTVFLSMREYYVFNQPILKNLAFIHYKAINVNFTFEFGTVNHFQQDVVKNDMNLKKSHILSIIALKHHVADLIPLHLPSVLFDLIDF